MHEQFNHSSASVTTYRLEGQTVDWETGFGVGNLRVDDIDYL